MGIALAHSYQVIQRFSNKETKAARLRQLMGNARSRREEGTKSKRKKKTEISVSFSWHDFDAKQKRYTQMRGPKGGGIRCIMTLRTRKLVELLDLAQSLFFPGGRSRKGKDLVEYKVSLADFAHTEIADLDINICDYMSEFGLTEAKFALLTKQLGRLERLKAHIYQEDLSSGDEFTTSNRSSETTVTNLAEWPSNIIEERRELIKEQDKAYEHSLAMDMEKDQVCDQYGGDIVCHDFSRIG